MRRLLRHLATILLTPVWAVAGPFDPVLVPESADWVVHLDMETARKSSLGSFVQSRIELAAEAELRRVSEHFRIDPFNDVHSITIFGDASDESRTGAIAMTSAAADDLANALQKEGMSDLTINRVSENTFLKWRDGQATWRAAVVPIDPERRALVFAHSTEVLETSLRLVATRKSDRPITSSWKVSPNEGSILFCIVREMPRASSGMPEAQILRSATALHFDLGESPEADSFVNLSIESDRPQDAMAIRELCGGLLALGRISSRGNAALQSKVETVTGSVEMKVEGTTFVLSSRQASKDIIHIMEEAIPFGLKQEKARPPEARRTGEEPTR
jgi:hypothetical protein